MGLGNMAVDIHWLTHNGLLPTTVVRFLHYHVVEVIKVKFSLECELVKCVKEVERECSSGLVVGGWVPPHL